MLVPELSIAEADPVADLAGLHRLAVWCQRLYTPTTAADPPAGIWLDVTGCGHLWASEEVLLVDLRNRLTIAGCASRIALADTPGAAYAVARHGREPVAVVMPGDAIEATRHLPITSLRLPSETIIGLRRLGFELVGDLMAAPRPQLSLRFGSEPGRRLDQLVGLLFESIDPVIATDTVRRRVSFVEPIGTAEAIKAGIERLVTLTCGDLEAQGLGARTLDLTCERIDGASQAIRVGMARPTRDPIHMIRLLGQRIEVIEPGFGVEAMVLAVPLADPLRPEAIGNLVHREPDGRDVASLVDSLSNRLGADRLYRAAAFESDVPERSIRLIPPLSPATKVTWPIDLPRPPRLLAPPEMIETTALLPDHPPAAFTWRAARHRVSRVDGPERIHGEWWRSDREIEALRDYFSVEDDRGSRYWLFRSGIDNAARWYMHGLF
jgi:protein ImuB